LPPSTPLTTPPPTPQAFAQAHGALAAWLRRRLTDLTANPDTAEDLCQRTWQAVWEAVSQGRYDARRAAMSTYVYAVSQNVYRRWARTQATAASHAPAIAANAPAPADAESDPLADAEIVDELRRTLRDGAPGLNLEHLGTLHLIAKGVTDRELARELSVAPSTAHTRKRDALEALRAHLNSRFFPERTPPTR
jgi:DNA-directed RNA polymerase specialized sigma24 family protein